MHDFKLSNSISWEIRPGVGLDWLSFGLTRDMVRSLLGAPEDIEEDFEENGEGGLSVTWYYWDLELSLHFDEDDDFRLGTIETSSTNSLLNGFAPVGMSVETYIENLREMGIFDIDYHQPDPDSSEHCLCVDSLGVDAWCDAGVIESIQFEVIRGDDDEKHWPDVKLDSSHPALGYRSYRFRRG